MTEPIFDPASIKATVETLLNTTIALPESKQGAFVLVVDHLGVRTVVAARINQVWEVQGVLGYHTAVGLDYGVTVKATW